MKTSFLKLKFLIALLIFPMAMLMAQNGDISKSFKKKFTVGKDVRLNVASSFGKVHCNVWDKNLLTVDVQIKVSARNDKEAQRIMNQIDSQITGNSSAISITTKVGSINTSGKSNSFSIDYIINMPRTTTLDIRNRFGDVFIDETTSQATLEVEYGNLSVNRLLNSASTVTLKFSNGNIAKSEKINYALEYSTLNIKEATDIDARTKFSTINIEGANACKINSEYDTYKIEKAKSLVGTSKFTTINADELLQTIDLNVEYGSLDVDKINPSFTLINLTASFNNISIGIPASASYALTANMSFGDCKYPKASTVKVTEKSFTSKSYSGHVGQSSNSSSKVTIKGNNSDVKLF